MATQTYINTQHNNINNINNSFNTNQDTPPFQATTCEQLISSNVLPENSTQVIHEPKEEKQYNPHFGRHNKKTPRAMKLLDDAWDFCKETTRLLKNEKIISKNSRWLGAYDIQNLNQEFLSSIFTANNIKVVYYTEFLERRRYQQRARSILITIVQKFDFLMDIHNYDYDKLDKWIDKAEHLVTMIDAWMKSDVTRYKDAIR